MADEQANPEEEKKAAPAPAAGGKNPLVAVLLLLNLVGMGAIAYLQFTAMKAETEKPSVRDIVKAEMKEAMGDIDDGEDFGNVKESDGHLFPLEGFTANLAQGDGPRRFVRLNAVLKFSSDSKEEEFKARKPQIRDTVISILNSKRPEDLLKKEGKAYLKEEIKAAINSFLIDGHVTDVYYVGFQIN